MLLSELTSARIALSGVVLFVATLALLPPAWLVVGRVFPGRNVFFARWGFLDLVKVILVGVVAVIASDALPRFEPTLLLVLTRLALFLGAMCAMAWYVAERSEPEGARTLGFRTDRVGSAIAAGVFLYLACLPGVIGLGFVSPWLAELGGGEWRVQQLLPLFTEAGGAGRVLAVVLMVAVVPLMEELLFRGFLQPLLVQNLREPAGVAVTSLVFAALHDSSVFLPVLGLSLVLGAIKLRTQRLWAVWFMHAMHNGVVLTAYWSSPELRAALGG